jgi:hypothetical protein
LPDRLRHNATEARRDRLTHAISAARQSLKYEVAGNILEQAMVLFCPLMRRRINAKHHRIVKQFTTGFPDRERSGLSYGIRPPAPGSCGKSMYRRRPAPPFFQLS